MPRHTLLDLTKATADEFKIGVIEEAIKGTPEIALGNAFLLSKGHSYATLIRTEKPAVGFRLVNSGIDPSKSTLTLKNQQCHLLSGRIECDRAIADIWPGGASAFQVLESIGGLESLYEKAATQFYYGLADDPNKGFPGLLASYDAANMTVDATGTGDATTSVWAVRYGERDLRWALGENTPLDFSQWRVESVTDEEGKKFPAYVADATVWLGLQFTHKYCAGRIKNLSTATGKTLTADMLYDLIEKFPAGKQPTHIFLNKRSMKQLRESLTTDLDPMPDYVESIGKVPLIVTDSIGNTETAA